ncbi:ABC transporter ATP-binding protein [Streptococcus pneumoniae]|uniref:ABC transporter ATP-binding protein n=2 Tax=Streptococcus pneumoniae TaxID=1313 RepID=UPI0005990167|nr:ABC transporter ATP-binding protein [Streptococcus pneumoniae]CEO61273.1 putative ABC-type multidrug transport system%2C ATpase component [Streptococcus pneumoniae]CEO64096.1 putative ABC-type multidrug transport system%2C ATpase component [Streptococcus pneumoniae]CEV56298.1 putative ABC-type multidrug transport system%2C ATpase component [Streptococcus pneumoniae]CEV60884.1 putative ABC-type multidrug transport system%2C ATpase component [Streptococcus pneumoniae]CEZ49764.1 putative ABC-t
MSLINVINLRRNFEGNGKGSTAVEALKGITFSIERGEIFGLLGPNGAGKSTTIKILSTMLLPTSGKVEISGYDIYKEERKIREKINFIFGGERSLYFRLSAEDNLFYFADLYKIPRKKQLEIVPCLLELVGLGDVANRRVETFSKGMKQRLQIARALLNDPEIIFLDEPSIGLDPVGALELRNIIKGLAQRGKTILLTTHYMPEAEELCDRIAIINHGEIVTCGTIEEIVTLLSDDEKSKILKEKLNREKTIDVTLEDIYLKLVR